jgi:glycosyltransferase involved in cell wall biosynthesis
VLTFSIVTATYNRLDNLKILYSNILNQKSFFYLIEWVVVVEKNDLVTINFLKKITNLKIIIVINKKNFSYLIASGVQKSNGDYIIILGDDDVLTKGSLNKIYKEIIANKYPSWIVGYCDYINNKKKVRKLTSYLKKKFLDFDNLFFLSFVNYYMCPAVVVKKNFLLSINYFPHDYGNVNDYKTWLDLRTIEKPKIIKSILASAGYGTKTISGSWNLNKYPYLFKTIINLNKLKSLKLIFLAGQLIILLSNLVSKSFINLTKFFHKKDSNNNIFNPQKKILHITRFFSDTSYGGIQEVIKQISYSNKFMHIVYATDSKNSGLKQYSNNLFYINFKKTFSLFGDICSLSLLRYLQQNLKNFNIIHIHYPHVFPFIYLLALQSKKKIIVTYHSDIIKNNIFKLFNKLILISFSKLISYYHVSSKRYYLNSAISSQKKIIIQNFSFIKNKIENKNIKKLIFSHNFNKYLIFIGRNTHYKNFSLLEHLCLSNQDMNFIILTNDKLNLNQKNIKIINNVNNDEKFYLLSRSRALLLPSNSRAESYGIVAIEAMMYGVPSIIFNINTGLNDLVKHNYNGLVAELDNNDQYSQLVKKIYFNNLLHKKLSSNSRKFYTKRLEKNGYSKLNKLYSTL